MQITLRKAANVSKDLLRAAGALRTQKNVILSVHMDDDEALVAINTAVAKNRENVALALVLTEAAYAVRRLIATKNASLGVDALLTEQAELTSKENVYSQAASGATYNAVNRDLALKVLKSNRERLANPNSYSSEDVTVSLASDADAETNKTELLVLRRAKSEINDKLTALNSANFVTLPEAIVTVLRDNNLV